MFNNRMVSNKYGLATDQAAYIGDIGLSANGPRKAFNEFSGTFGNSHTYNFENFDPNYNPGSPGLPAPPKYYYNDNNYMPQISNFHASTGYQEIKVEFTNQNTNNVSCYAPLLVSYDDGKAKDAVSSNKSWNGNRPHWNRKGNGSDSALYLRQQLQFYHLSKDSARYNSQQFSSFRDSMKNTALGRALGKNSTGLQMSGLNNFDQNVITVEPILSKHFSDSTLTKAELDQLRQIAVLCPYTDGIAVYQARRVLHEYGDRLLVNDCEISKQQPNNNGKGKPRIKVSDSTAFNLSLYPNPASGQLFVNLVSSKESVYQLEIRDVIGKKVRTLPIKANTTDKINLGQMQSGVYFVRLLEDGQIIQTEKLVIQ
jgi:hypothetical protein